MLRTRHKITLIPAVGIALVFLVISLMCGCGRGSDEKAGTQRGVVVDADVLRGKIVAKTEDGRLITGTPAIPASFPKDIPIYPDTRVLEAMEADSGGMFFIRLETRDAPKKTADTYRDTMKSQGWKETETFVSRDIIRRDYKKGDRAVTIAAGVFDGKTQIQIEARQKK